MDSKMSKALGLDKIKDLIQMDGEFFSQARRVNLSQAFRRDLVPNEYRKLQAVMLLRKQKKDKYEALLAIFAQMNVIAAYSRHKSIGLTDLFEVKSFLYYYQEMRAIMEEQGLMKLYGLHDMSEYFQLLDPDDLRLPSFRLSPTFSPALGKASRELDALSAELKHLRANELEAAKQMLDLPNLKYDFVLSRSQTALISAIESSGYFIRSLESVANLNYSLADSPKAMELKQKINSCKKSLQAAEDEVVASLTARLIKDWILLDSAKSISESIAWHLMLADFAATYDCCIPSISKKPGIKLKGARNLATELELKKQGRSYQAQDIDLKKNVNLLTGPNMGGKSNLLACLGQIAWMVSKAIPILAESGYVFAFDMIYFNHEDNLPNLSSFGREIVALKDVMEYDCYKLILLDEFAKGTNPLEAEALNTALLSYFTLQEDFVVASTHYVGPTLIPEIGQYRMAGLDREKLGVLGEDSSLSARLKKLAEAMDYRVLKVSKGQAPPQDAIAIALSLGFSEAILMHADMMLQDFGGD